MASLPLLNPSDCAVVLVDVQAGLAFAAGSADRQGIRNAALALAKTAVAFSVPVVVSTSASKVYSGPPLLKPLQAFCGWPARFCMTPEVNANPDSLDRIAIR